MNNQNESGKKTNSAAIWMWLSAAAASLSLAASILGIFDAGTYARETANWALQARGQDTGNLLAALFMAASLYLLKKKSLKGYFLWLGTLLYYIYAYLIYAFATRFNPLFLVYTAVLGLSVYSLAGAVSGRNFSRLTEQVGYSGKTKAGAYLLIAIGILFGFIWLGEIIPALLAGSLPKSLDGTGLYTNPVHVIDLSIVLPGMVATGLLFLKRKRSGYLLVAPWLAFSVLMGSSIVATMAVMVGQSPAAWPPLIMTGTIVLLSLAALAGFFGETKD